MFVLEALVVVHTQTLEVGRQVHRVAQQVTVSSSSPSASQNSVRAQVPTARSSAISESTAVIFASLLGSHRLVSV